MAKLRSFAVLSALVAGAVGVSGAAPAQAPKQEWVSVKGQVVLLKANIPAAAVGNEVIAGIDKPVCEAKGPLAKNVLIVNAKNDGVKNVVVWLRPDTDDRKDKLKAEQINPALAKAPAKNHLVDQPCCQFEPRVLAVRVGDTLEVKNSASITHNIKYDGDNAFNVNLPKGMSHKMEQPFGPSAVPVIFGCSTHPWMAGRIRTFEHPYFAVTDADGKFEIKDAPAGKFRVVYWHELGFHKGKAGPLGIAETLTGPATQLKPLELELPPQ